MILEKFVLALTTCRSPSKRTRSFVKELALNLPFVLKINRGKRKIEDVFYEAYLNRVRFVMFVYEWKGNPRLIKIYKLKQYFTPSHPSDSVVEGRVADLRIRGLKLTREIRGFGRVYNVAKIGVLYEGCSSDQCFTLSDLVERIYGGFISDDPDVYLVIRDEDNDVVLEFKSRLNKPCGPLIRFSEVKSY